MLQPINDISAALGNIAMKVYGALYDYNQDVEDKKMCYNKKQLQITT